MGSEVTLDIEALTQCSGQGMCREVQLCIDTADRYRDEMETWAKSRNWRLEYVEDALLILNKF